MNIDTTTYLAGNDNHYQPNNIKTQIVIGFSFRGNSNHILRLINKDYGKSKEWNHFTITRDGIIYQHFDSKKHSDFIGIKEADIRTISIVLENMGFLYSDNGYFRNWLNEECDPDNVGIKKYGSFNHWEKFTKEQITSLSLLCKNICDEFNIPTVVIDFDCYNKDIRKFKGIAVKSNYYEVGNINPLFDLGELNDKINKL